MGLIIIIIGLVCCASALVCGLLANRKGYNIYIWTIAGGWLISFVVLSFLPFVSQTSKDKSRKIEKNGNLLGAVFAVPSVFGFIGFLISLLD